MNSISDIKNIFYINLDTRPDRKAHVENELNKVGLKGQRFNAIKMQNGALGCSMSHLEVLKNAKANSLDHVLIVEDDITFINISLFTSQLNNFLFKNKEWDVLLIAGNNKGYYEKKDDTCVKITKCITTTGYLIK
uniref:Glycosyl transferase family 25 domain-containing protein n=1 Tax=viral metagenome TaxID=1070528 RepID=A0A6C0ERX9_9ZZZZ